MREKLTKFHRLGFIYLVVFAGGIIIGLFFKPMFFPTIAPTKVPVPTINTPASPFPTQQPNSSFNCPTDEWINCMPSPDSNKPAECEPLFLEWAVKNCPKFKGVAY